MILTVTPNASIDKTFVIDGFGVDRLNRPSQVTTVPGGKGINVVRVLKELGQQGVATGFVGGGTGDAIVTGLNAEGIRHDFIRVEGESRLCVKIMDPSNGTQTEINEIGPNVSIEQVTALTEKIAAMAVGAEFIVLCGNCPPGVPDSFYSEIIRTARRSGVKAILDTSGEQLREGIKAGPFMVNPNVVELSELAETELCTIEEISRAAKSLKQFGVEVAAVTMGRSGAMVTNGVQAWQAVPPEISFASAVGSGDAFVAAFIDSLLHAEPLDAALAWATAAGAANATTYGAGFCSKESIMELRQGVTLSKLE